MIHTTCLDRPTRPVGKILGVGRNYAAHAREMGHAPPAEPMWFLKPSTALWFGGEPLVLPDHSQEVHHEVELVIRLGDGGVDLDLERAAACVDACAVGLDLTARDLQRIAKERGEPWSVAKGFDRAAPISALHPVHDVAELGDLELSLAVNGQERQRGHTRDLCFGVAELVAHASRRFRLEAGDLIFTGTPEGVGPIRAGDQLHATLSLGLHLKFSVAAGR